VRVWHACAGSCTGLCTASLTRWRR
jgi:hypothetical protein